MRLRHEFTVPVSVDEAWPVLGDLGRVAPCLPGATLTAATPREVEGKLRVRVGSVTVTYRGSAGVTELDEAERRAVITVRGREARGDGSVRATITARLHDVTDGTRVTVATDLSVTGRLGPAGRDALSDAVGRMLDRLAGRLTELLAGTGADQPPVVPVGEAAPVPPDGARADHPEAVAMESEPDPELAPQVDPEVDSELGRDRAPGRGPARPARATSPMASFVDRSTGVSGWGVPALRRAAPLLALILLALLIRRRRRR